MSVAPQPFPTHRDRRTPRGQGPLGHGQPAPQPCQPARLSKPLGRSPIAPPTAAPPRVVWVGELTGTQCAPLLNNLDRRPQIRRVSGQPAHPQLILVLHRTGDRTRPPRRGHRGDGLLALGAPSRPTVTIPHATTDPAGQLTAIHRAQHSPDDAQRLSLARREMHAGTNPRPAGAAATTGSPIRRNDRFPPIRHILTATTDNTEHPYRRSAHLRSLPSTTTHYPATSCHSRCHAVSRCSASNSRA
jgi:hypothetical protein